MEKMIWSDRAKNEEVLQSAKEKTNIDKTKTMES